ncbi:hypothetical protein [Nocardia lijiangensis]|uniref:hypothetical protein n=1 Tax=Nocardia lijiangensis TaxID=299618 RepID=UPI003D708CAE
MSFQNCRFDVRDNVDWNMLNRSQMQGEALQLVQDFREGARAFVQRRRPAFAGN